jgi:hypothetical protein
MQIAVLGSGPAGLAAVHAAVLAGYKRESITVISSGWPSKLYGAQYLHAPIPEVSPNSSIHVAYRLQGTSVEYRSKVYSGSYDGTVSPEDLEAEHDAWDIRQTYRNLWGMYEDLIKVGHITQLSAAGLKAGFDFVISTIPANELCMERMGGADQYMVHWFQARSIWAAGDAPELGIRIPYRQCPDATVMCNGESEPSWYRLSNVFGHSTVEWPGTIGQVPIAAAQVMKPVRTNCDCHISERWIRIGRYGAWDKMQLVHSAFNKVYDRLKEMA